MGYVLFTNRKLMLTEMIYQVNQELEAINEKRLQLLSKSAIIEDGIVTDEEMAENPSIRQWASDYRTAVDETLNGLNSNAPAIAYDFQQTLLAYGQAHNISMASDAESRKIYYNFGNEKTSKLSEEQQQAELFQQAAYQHYAQELAKQADDELEEEDHKLDLKQKKLETKLTAMQKELEQVEQAEAKAIENATPKYAGLG